LTLDQELRELPALRLTLEWHVRLKLHPSQRVQHVAKQRDLRIAVEPVPRHGQSDDVRVRAPPPHRLRQFAEHCDAELVQAMLLDDARGLRAPTIRDRRKDRVCLLAETRLV